MSTTATSTASPRTNRSSAKSSETLSQIQSLAQRIQAMLSTKSAQGRVIGVTSCVRREGVSVVAANLASCAADLSPGKVLLVDANPRRAAVASRFGVRPSPGLADCLSGELAAQECITGTTHENLFVLPAGPSDPHPGRFADARAIHLTENLRQDFELIVIDLPPASEMDETVLASQLVDGFLLVLESERTRRQVAQRVKRQFEQVNARVLGVVLNKRKNHIPGWLYHRL